jgi:hypothetical protein
MAGDPEPDPQGKDEVENYDNEVRMAQRGERLEVRSKRGGGAGDRIKQKE